MGPHAIGGSCDSRYDLVRKFRIERGDRGEFTQEQADQKANPKQLRKASGVSHCSCSIPCYRMSKEQRHTSAITISTILCETKMSAVTLLRLLET